jgi:hypothetical protein
MISGAPISGSPIAGGPLVAIPYVDPEYQFSGDAAVLVWAEFTDAQNTGYYWSKVALADPAAYYGGYKDASILEWGEIQRALSDYRGAYEGATFACTRSDTDRLLRGLLGAAATRVMFGRPILIRSISDAGRRALQTPRTLARGIVRQVEPVAPLKFKITAEDYFSAKFTIGASDVQIPRRTITRADFPAAPLEALDRPVPILYGHLGDGLIVDKIGSRVPVITGDPGSGFFLDGPYPYAGFGVLPPTDATIDPPRLPAVTAIAGGTVSADVPDATYGVIMTTVDASGRESNPSSFYYNAPNVGRGSWAAANTSVQTVAVDGSQAIRVSWAAMPGAARYRVYLGYYYFGARWVQMIDTAATTCTFTTSPSSADAPDPANITPGAAPPRFTQLWHYSVSAVISGGETGRSVEVFGTSSPYRRPIRIEWFPVPGATAYKVYRRAPGGVIDRVWTVTAPPDPQPVTVYFDDDLLDTSVTYLTTPPGVRGLVPVTYVGELADVTGTAWSAFLVCGHAVKAIDGWFAGGVAIDYTTAGVSWAVPGWPGFSTYFPNTGSPQYRDLNGRRYTLIYVRGPDAAAAIANTAPITLNVQGIETAGDGSGALITALPLQYRHALQNWLLGDYQAGAWLASPPMPGEATLAQIDDPSFDYVATLFAARVSGGYPGAFLLGAGAERISMRDTMTRFHLCGMDAGFNRKMQFFVTTINPDPGLLAKSVALTQLREIHADSVTIADDVSQWFNVHPYDYARDYQTAAADPWTGSGEARDDALISAYGGETRTAPRVQLHMIRDPTVASSIMGIRLLLTAEPPRLVTCAAGLEALDIEPGDLITITHLEGPGAGWTNNPLRVARHDFNPETLTVRLEAYDANRIVGAHVAAGAA